MKITGLPNLGRQSEVPATKPKEFLGFQNVSPDRAKRKTEVVDLKKDVNDFLYNEVSAKRLQEFQVVKINHRGKRQNRILGIDGY